MSLKSTYQQPLKGLLGLATVVVPIIILLHFFYGFCIFKVFLIIVTLCYCI